jgi:DNA-binding MarR family transcriptional regulator
LPVREYPCSLRIRARQRSGPGDGAVARVSYGPEHSRSRESRLRLFPCETGAVTRVDTPTDWTDSLLHRLAEIHPDLELTVYQVTARVARVATLLARQQEEVFQRFGLNRGEVGVLSALRTADPPHRLSPTRLLHSLMLSSAGITGRIDRLERRGLVERMPDPGDRRAILVALTDRGREVVDAAIAANTAAEARFLAGFEDDEVAILSRLLRKLLANLEPSSP